MQRQPTDAAEQAKISNSASFALLQCQTVDASRVNEIKSKQRLRSRFQACGMQERDVCDQSACRSRLSGQQEGLGVAHSAHHSSVSCRYLLNRCCARSEPLIPWTNHVQNDLIRMNGASTCLHIENRDYLSGCTHLKPNKQTPDVNLNSVIIRLKGASDSFDAPLNRGTIVKWIHAWFFFPSQSRTRVFWMPMCSWCNETCVSTCYTWLEQRV